MTLLICEKHGECGVMPTVSKNLADAISSGIANKKDIATIYLQIFDGDEYLGEKIFFVYSPIDMKNLKPEYIIKNELDDELFGKQVSPLFHGGGYCVKCFKEYVDSIGFDLNTLKCHSGITI